MLCCQTKTLFGTRDTIRAMQTSDPSPDPEVGTPLHNVPYTPWSDAREFGATLGSSYRDPVYVKHPLLSGPLTLIALCAGIYLLVFLQDVLVTITFAVFMM